jgi:hypothetical protein
VGESVVQTAIPYGVREALAVFAIEVGGTSLAKGTVGASESHAVAPEPPKPPPPPPDGKKPPDDDGDRPPDDDGPDGPGPGPGPDGGGPPTGLLDGGPGDGPTRPAAFAGGADAARDDDDGRLALTGVDLIWIALLGSA